MSTEDVKKIKNAYEQMLEDGTAFKEVDMSMVVEPDISMAEGKGALGDVVETAQPSIEKDENSFIDENTDFSSLDNAMEQRMNSLKSKMKNGGTSPTPSKLNTPAKRIAQLEKKVKQLEEALILVMQTHEEMLE